jgi:hypothetical protein
VRIVKNERDPPLFSGKLLIKFQNILKNTTQVIIEVYSIQQYVIKFVSDLQQVSGFLQVMLYVSLGLFELLALCVGRHTLAFLKLLFQMERNFTLDLRNFNNVVNFFH